MTTTTRSSRNGPVPSLGHYLNTVADDDGFRMRTYGLALLVVLPMAVLAMVAGVSQVIVTAVLVVALPLFSYTTYAFTVVPGALAFAAYGDDRSTTTHHDEVEVTRYPQRVRPQDELNADPAHIRSAPQKRSRHASLPPSMSARKKHHKRLSRRTATRFAEQVVSPGEPARRKRAIHFEDDF